MSSADGCIPRVLWTRLAAVGLAGGCWSDFFIEVEVRFGLEDVCLLLS